jgi:glucokinase
VTDRPPARNAAPAAVGLDVGGTKLLGVVLDAGGRVLATGRVPTPQGGDALVEALGTLVESLDEQAGVRLPVGVGAPGMIDRAGTICFSANLAGVAGLPLPARLSDRLGGRSVRVENDATCAGWAEAAQGAARGSRDVLLITLGTGIGSGVILDGRLVRGANGFAGEVGHMTIDPNGPLCPCGRNGCWERYASGSGLGRLAREAAHAGRGGRLVELAGGDPESVRGEHVTAAAREGDDGALAVMDRFGWWLAAGLANLADAFDPEIFVIGGGLVHAGDVLLGPTRAHFPDLVQAGRLRPTVRIVPADLGEKAGAIGAALLATTAP